MLIYRLISFWGVLVVGWLAWGWGALGVRRGRWPRQALEATVEVAPDAVPDFEPPTQQAAVSAAPPEGAP